jgi:hypothetical protein
MTGLCLAGLTAITKTLTQDSTVRFKNGTISI